MLLIVVVMWVMIVGGSVSMVVEVKSLMCLVMVVRFVIRVKDLRL